MDISGTAFLQKQTKLPFTTSNYNSETSKKPMFIFSPIFVSKQPEESIIETLKSQETTIGLTSYGRVDKYKLIRGFSNKHANPVFLAQIDSQDPLPGKAASLVVIKTLDVSDSSFNNEVNILSLPPHKNIITCKEILKSAAVEINFKSQISNAIVLEYAINGDLYPYLECGPLPESICRFYFEQLLDAIEHFHNNGYCHLDIKPENTLLDEKFNMKLTDFGYAVPYTMIVGNKTVNSSCGTSAYYPPEMWNSATKEKGYDGTKADIFQLGLLLFIMITGQPPFFKSHSSDGWFGLLARGRWDEFWDYKEKGLTAYSSVTERPIFSSELRNLLRVMLEPQPNMRTTIESIRKTKWYLETFPAEPIELQFEMMNRKALKKLD